MNNWRGLRKMMSVSRLSNEYWAKYWLEFQSQYREKDSEGILARMEKGRHNDLCATEKAVKDLLGQEYGIQFGLAKGNRPEMRKVEVRMKPEVFQMYFAANLPEIVARIADLGGTYTTTSPTKVINCFFSVPGDGAESYERIFEMYSGFKEIILDYYLGRK